VCGDVSVRLGALVFLHCMGVCERVWVGGVSLDRIQQFVRRLCQWSLHRFEYLQIPGSQTNTYATATNTTPTELHTYAEAHARRQKNRDGGCESTEKLMRWKKLNRLRWLVTLSKVQGSRFKKRGEKKRHRERFKVQGSRERNLPTSARIRNTITAQPTPLLVLSMTSSTLRTEARMRESVCCTWVSISSSISLCMFSVT
jgi:hypothetical protein